MTCYMPPASRMAGPWTRIAMYVVSLAGIPLLYGIVGTAIVYAGRTIGWIP